MDTSLRTTGNATRRLRVLLAVGTLQLGGTERQVTLLAEGLHTAGAAVLVTALYGGGARQVELQNAGVLHWVGNVPRKQHVIRLAASVIQFSRLVRRFRPDVLHAFLPHAELLAGPVGRWTGVPVVIAGRRSLGTFREGQPFLRAAEMVTRRSFDAFVANCGAVADEALDGEPIRPDQMHVIPNALPEDSFVERTRPPLTGAGRPNVVYVANLIGYKHHEVLMKAAASLSTPVVLQFVGDGPRRPVLEKMATDLAVDVRFLGQRQQVGPILAQADLMVHASSEEGMSNALMEGMAAGLPIVATDVGGNREVLADTGLLCPPGDPSAMAAVMEHVLANPEQARELGVTARARATKSFSVEQMVAEHFNLYQELLGTR